MWHENTLEYKENVQLAYLVGAYFNKIKQDYYSTKRGLL